MSDDRVTIVAAAVFGAIGGATGSVWWGTVLAIACAGLMIAGVRLGR